jgi:hypothetical protein
MCNKNIPKPARNRSNGTQAAAIRVNYDRADAAGGGCLIKAATSN